MRNFVFTINRFFLKNKNTDILGNFYRMNQIRLFITPRFLPSFESTMSTSVLLEKFIWLLLSQIMFFVITIYILFAFIVSKKRKKTRTKREFNAYCYHRLILASKKDINIRDRKSLSSRSATNTTYYNTALSRLLCYAWEGYNLRKLIQRYDKRILTRTMFLARTCSWYFVHICRWNHTSRWWTAFM